MNNPKDRSRPLWRYVFLVFLVLAAIGIGTSVLVFSSWSQLESATPDEATISFETAMALIKDKREYLTISESGKVDVQRGFEKQYPSKLAALNLLAYEPGASRLVRVRFPFWFVKLKTTSDINLGTMVSLLSKDWEHLDLKVTENDLMHRGPGLVLDHTRSDGGRIVLWSE